MMGAPSLPSSCVLLIFGLLLLFFGVFLLQFAVSTGLGLLAGRFAHDRLLGARLPLSTVAVGALIIGACAFCISLALCVRTRMTGPLLGAVIALSLLPTSAAWVQTTVTVLVLGFAFGAAYAMAPKEVAVFVSSYAGSYLVWHGLELIDDESLGPHLVVPAFVSPTNVDMWFSVLSFLVVGCLGCCVQLILLGGQEGTVSEREHYVPIP